MYNGHVSAHCYTFEHKYYVISFSEIFHRYHLAEINISPACFAIVAIVLSQNY